MPPPASAPALQPDAAEPPAAPAAHGAPVFAPGAADAAAGVRRGEAMVPLLLPGLLAVSVPVRGDWRARVLAAPGRWWRGRERVPGTLSGPATLLLVFIPFALGHYLSWLLRSVNAMLAPQLLAQAGLTPAQLGLLTSTYFLAFAVAQLPVGMALDRYGPRRVQFVLLLVAALGTLAFAGSRDFATMAMARGLMGLGLAGCFMAAIKALTTWLPAHKTPSVQGYLIAAGGLGAATATLPVRLALHHMSWQWMMLALAACCIAVALLVLLLAPTPPAAPPRPFGRNALAGTFAHPVFRETALLVLLPHTVFFGVQGLWIARWMADVPRFGEEAIAWLLYLGMAAVIFGSIGVGMLTEWAARRGWRALDVAAAGVLLFVLLQCAFASGWRPPQQMLPVLFMLVGCVTGMEFSIVAQAIPPALTGRASTCLNLLIFIGAFIVQAGFGQVVGLWRPSALGHHPAIAYQCAFAVLVLIQLPGLCRYLLRRFR
ncbi:MFS transporter [Pseudoduganella sp. OTU4001]|uniref:MFS transporter n=1 Tax=Pseudoduganella sp. OTU4001 TaxID=3043854 RepID=UPI00313DDFDB